VHECAGTRDEAQGLLVKLSLGYESLDLLLGLLNGSRVDDEVAADTHTRSTVTVALLGVVEDAERLAQNRLLRDLVAENPFQYVNWFIVVPHFGNHC
jgi:hypothetical protein